MALKELRLELTRARRLASTALAVELEGDIESRTRELSHLIENVGPVEASEIALGLASGLPAERSLSAHLLRQVCEVAPSGRVNQQILEMLADERDPAVVAPLVAALGWTRQSGFLPCVLGYLLDPSSLVRHAVSCSLPMFFPDARAAAGLVSLAQDVDDDVRWSAVFELGAWIREVDDDQIPRLLTEIASKDPNDEIRSQAAEGLIEAARRRGEAE
jgi:HEAT repeat protein